DADRAIVDRIAEAAEVLVFARCEVEPHDLRAVRVLDPSLAVDLRSRDREVRLLRGVRLPFVRHRKNFEGLSRAIEARHPRLIHQADPEIAVGVDLEIEGPFGMIGLLHGNREIRYFPGLRVELGQELFAEMRVPDHAVEIDDDVVWLDFLPRKAVFRDDDPRRAPRRTRRNSGREAMRRLPAEIDAREIPGEFFWDGGIDVRPAVLADEPLRLQVGGAGVVAAHALEDLQEISRRMFGFEYSAQRMAIRAVEQRSFEALGPRHAR